MSQQEQSNFYPRGVPNPSPVLERLMQLRDKLNVMNLRANEFRARLNGHPPEPLVTKVAPGTPDRSPCSIEDLISTIESHVHELEAIHDQLTQRF